jgi:hypothetical protein
MSELNPGASAPSSLLARAFIGGTYGVIAGIVYENVEAAFWPLELAEELVEIILEVVGFGLAGAAFCVAWGFMARRLKS